jgi:uracil-DNA glycosylase
VDQAPNDMTPEDAARALNWLIAMGADEIMADIPQDRFEASKAKPVVAPEAAPVQAAPALTRANLGDVPTGDDAATVAAACASLDALAAAFDQFTACGLRKSVTHTCFLGGVLDAPILVLGDRPRDDEEREGQVFAGKNAVLLDNMLRAIGLNIGTVMLGNVIPWRPPGNRTPTEIEIKQCTPFMRRAIALAKPKLILSFGGLGGQALAGAETSVARQRGKWLSIDGVPAMATFHPEELLTAPARKKLAWRDLLMFRARMIELGLTP